MQILKRRNEYLEFLKVYYSQVKVILIQFKAYAWSKPIKELKQENLQYRLKHDDNYVIELGCMPAFRIRSLYFIEGNVNENILKYVKEVCDHQCSKTEI